MPAGILQARRCERSWHRPAHKQILGSCQSIVDSLGAVRNKLGDAHSQGPAKARPQPRHAKLAVNLSGSMATFLCATWEAKKAAAAGDK